MTPSQTRYGEYLKSPYWALVTEAVKRRGGYRCQICNSPHDLTAHHRTYEHRGDELNYLDDLICMCRRCHSIFHGVMAPPESPLEAWKEKTPQALELTEVTPANFAKLKLKKDVWHWLNKRGINPRQAGWKRRSVGQFVPQHFFH